MLKGPSSNITEQVTVDSELRENLVTGTLNTQGCSKRVKHDRNNKLEIHITLNLPKRQYEKNSDWVTAVISPVHYENGENKSALI